MLLLDSFSGHWTGDVKEYAASRNVILKQIPPGLTWRCQPADVAWMKPLKDRLRRKWVNHLKSQIDRRVDQSRTFAMRPPDRGDVTEWITDAWYDLSDQVIISGFSRCGFTGGLPRASEEPSDQVPIDTENVINTLVDYGCIDRSVGEVDTSMDILDSTLVPDLLEATV